MAENATGTDSIKRDHPVVIASSGIVAAVLVIVTCMSFAALIYQGELAPYLHIGLGCMIFSASVHLVVTALGSSLPFIISEAQDIPAAILAIGAGVIVAEMGGAAPQTVVASVVMLIMVTSLVTGVLFYLLGRFGLGNLVRYIPYPVVGGFLAGTGWVLLFGGVGIMTGVPLNLSSLGQYLSGDMALLWIPGLGFALLLFAATSFIRHHFTAPGIIFFSCILFFLIIHLAGISLDEARSSGLLLSGLPERGIWSPPDLAMLEQVRWDMVLGNWVTILTVASISGVAMLLNTSGLELIARRDIDLNRELRTSGLACLLSGAGGGAPGYPSISITALNRALGSRGRAAGVFAGLLCVAVLFAGARALEFFPVPILGGLVSFLGLGLLKEWLVDSVGRLPWLEYGLMLLILAHIVFVGFFEGVAFGLVAAVAIFVFKYSKAPIIRSTHDAASLPSVVERNPVDRHLLATMSDRILLLRLQGYLFFGTVSRLLDCIREWSSTQEMKDGVCKYIILDFTLVTGLDSSLLNGFTKLVQLAEARHMTIVVTGLGEQDARRFERSGHVGGEHLQFIASRSEAVEWCEDSVLNTMQRSVAAPGACVDGSMPGFRISEVALDRAEEGVRALERFEDALAPIMDHLEERMLASGDVLIEQGQTGSGLYFLASGALEAVLRSRGGKEIRVRKILPGSIVGEMSHYCDSRATVTVRTLEQGRALFLSGDSLRELEETRPQDALQVHRLAAHFLSCRLEDANLLRDALM